MTDQTPNYYAWKLPSGKPLGSATKEDLEEARAHFETLESKYRLKRLRLQATGAGYMIRKDRAQAFSMDHQGGYRLVDADRNAIVAGERFDLDLDDLEKWLAG